MWFGYEYDSTALREMVAGFCAAMLAAGDAESALLLMSDLVEFIYDEGRETGYDSGRSYATCNCEDG